MRSGVTNLNDGFLRTAGINGYNWSASANEFNSALNGMAHYLGFYASHLLTTGGTRRWDAFPLRC